MKRVPKLRFKEFSDEWEEKKLGDTLNLGNGKDYRHLKKGEIPVYGTGGIIEKVDNFLYEGESVFIGRKGSINKPVYYNGKFWTVDTLFYTYNFIDVLPKFVYYTFCNIDWFSYNEATGVPSLSKTTILKIKNNIPTLQEQEKIANFLSSVDKKISLTEEKLELFKQYKKGVMQKLFSQEMRFKDSDGNDYPDWEEKRLGDIVELQGGYAFKSEKFKTNGIPIIRISNISNISNTGNGIDINNLVYYEENLSLENFIINNGDFLIALSGATVGKTAIFNLKQKAYLNQRVGVFRKISDFYYKFITQYGKSDFFHKQIDNIIVAGAQPNISPKDIENFIIKLPCIEEQEKIAGFLSSIDEKIENIEKELEGLKEFKKGLLQKMFV